MEKNAVAWTVVGPDGKSSIGGWLDMRDHDFWKQRAVLREGHHYAYAYAPAAPGIDLEQFREAVEAQYSAGMEQWCGGAEEKQYLTEHRDRLLALIDASPNGGSTDSPVCFISPLDAHMLRSREKTLRWTGTYWEKKHDDMVPVYLGAPTAMQATSAEVGA